MSTTSLFLYLPLECLYVFLSTIDLANLEASCAMWREEIHENGHYAWEYAYRRDFGRPSGPSLSFSPGETKARYVQTLFDFGGPQNIKAIIFRGVVVRAKRVWDTLLAAGKELDVTLLPPPSPREIDALEGSLALRFPIALRALLFWHGGQAVSSRVSSLMGGLLGGIEVYHSLHSNFILRGGLEGVKLMRTSHIHSDFIPLISSGPPFLAEPTAPLVWLDCGEGRARGGVYTLSHFRSTTLLPAARGCGVTAPCASREGPLEDCLLEWLETWCAELARGDHTIGRVQAKDVSIPYLSLFRETGRGASILCSEAGISVHLSTLLLSPTSVPGDAAVHSKSRAPERERLWPALGAGGERQEGNGGAWNFAYRVTFSRRDESAGSGPVVLETRHLEFSDASARSERSVDGEGVIGLFPRLHIFDPVDHSTPPFHYCSQTGDTIRLLPGRMGGSFAFRVERTGAKVRALMAPVVLQLQPFLFS
jgi:uncharacterized protein affecting Mg2+/Co2+ transport